ncbi:MAG: MBL fold metallo-hydrolase [Oscillochloris sp.]|nr:MBL fold metallo-hydrolase [Oscillochloris sp.]
MDNLITRHITHAGARIYRLPMRVFPSLIAFAHLVISEGYVALVDVGSGLGDSHADLCAAFDRLAVLWGEPVGWDDLDRIVITHAHIDHHGGLNAIRTLSDAPIAVHILDRRVLVHYEERLALTRVRISQFLQQAGLDSDQRTQLLALYNQSKGVFQSLPVQDSVQDGDLLDERFRIYHVPGHCPGQICLQLDNILLSADHILPDVALFLAPESLTASTGLEHFLQSLRKAAQIPDLQVSLGGHGAPVHTIAAAIAQIEQQQQRRIARLHNACTQAQTLAELAAALYPRAQGYDQLLALQKIGAYVEYLDQRGMLAIVNYREVAADEHVAPRYQAWR